MKDEYYAHKKEWDEWVSITYSQTLWGIVHPVPYALWSRGKPTLMHWLKRAIGIITERYRLDK